MLHEIKNVKQEPGGGRRRWFETDGFELVVWLGARGEVTGFQVCYDFGRGQHALTWRENSGFAHAAVDGGDASPLRNEVPVLTPDADVPWLEIARAFDAHSATLEPALRGLVRDRLAERVAAGADWR